MQYFTYNCPIRYNYNCIFRAGYIEQFGSGTLRMTKQLLEAGHPEPEFEEQGNGFVVSFAESTHPTLEDLINERQLKALELAVSDEIQASDLHEHFPNITRKTISRDLGELVEKGFLIKKGKGKGTRYLLKGEN